MTEWLSLATFRRKSNLMSHTRQQLQPSAFCTPRPLPPVPLLFSSSVVGGNVRVLDGGEGVEWCMQLPIGMCQLDRPLRKGEHVKLEVKGTGYFSIILKSWASTPLSTEKEMQLGDVLHEVILKLKRSRFLIEIRRPSRKYLNMYATSASGTSIHNVTLPHSGVDPGPCVMFNVLFGELRFILVGGEGNQDKPWQFHNTHGLNIRRISRQEVTSLHPNPCASAVTERPITSGETVELRVVPQNADNSRTEVKVCLTHCTPQRLNLHKPRVYFSDSYGLDGLLSEMYTVRKFHGTLRLRVDAEKDVLEIEEKSCDRGRNTVRTRHLNQVGLDARKPLYVCVAVLRTRVDIVQRVAGSEHEYSQFDYACFAPGQAVSRVAEYLTLQDGIEDGDGYLISLQVAGPPPPPFRAPPPPPRSLSDTAGVSPRHLGSSPGTPGPLSSSSYSLASPATPRFSPHHRSPGAATPPSTRSRFFPTQPPVPEHSSTDAACPRSGGSGSFGEEGAYMSMDGYILPSRKKATVQFSYESAPVASSSFCPSHPDPTYLTPIPSLWEDITCRKESPLSTASSLDSGCAGNSSTFVNGGHSVKNTLPSAVSIPGKSMRVDTFPVIRCTVSPTEKSPSLTGTTGTSFGLASSSSTSDSCLTGPSTIGNTSNLAGSSTIGNTSNLAGSSTVGNTSNLAGSSTIGSTSNLAGSSSAGNCSGLAGSSTSGSSSSLAGCSGDENSFGLSEFSNAKIISCPGNLPHLAGSYTTGNFSGSAGSPTCGNSSGFACCPMCGNSSSFACCPMCGNSSGFACCPMCGNSSSFAGPPVCGNSSSFAGPPVCGNSSSVAGSMTGRQFSSLAGSPCMPARSVSHIAHSSSLPAFTVSSTLVSENFTSVAVSSSQLILSSDMNPSADSYRLATCPLPIKAIPSHKGASLVPGSQMVVEAPPQLMLKECSSSQAVARVTPEQRVCCLHGTENVPHHDSRSHHSQYCATSVLVPASPTIVFANEIGSVHQKDDSDDKENWRIQFETLAIMEEEEEDDD